jgi:hypothetical protein
MHPLRPVGKNNSTSFLSFGPSTALHLPAHIQICTGKCAWWTDQHPAQSCGIIFPHWPESMVINSEASPRTRLVIIVSPLYDSKVHRKIKVYHIPEQSPIFKGITL